MWRARVLTPLRRLGGGVEAAHELLRRALCHSGCRLQAAGLRGVGAQPHARSRSPAPLHCRKHDAVLALLEERFPDVPVHATVPVMPAIVPRPVLPGQYYYPIAAVYL